MEYNVSNPFIEYKDTREYRETLRQIFYMKHIEETEYDEESNDELNYDFEKINNTMENLFQQTKENPLFQTLYDLAAAKMISLDRTIGQSILFSYDFFYLFHACLCVYLTSPEKFTQDCEYYKNLKEKLEKR